MWLVPCLIKVLVGRRRPVVIFRPPTVSCDLGPSMDTILRNQLSSYLWLVSFVAFARRYSAGFFGFFCFLWFLLGVTRLVSMEQYDIPDMGDIVNIAAVWMILVIWQPEKRPQKS